MPGRFCAAVVAVWLAAACASTGPPRLLAFPDPDIRPVASLDAINEYDTAAASVLAVIDDLGFGSYALVFQFCPDAAAFEATLLESGYDRALARDTSNTMQAVGGFRRIIINAAALGTEPWPARVAMLAHEVGHSLQYEWGGGRRGASDQWLREGFAEWLSMQVLDRLHGLSAATARTRNLQTLRRYTPSPREAPALEDMVTFRQWVRLGKRENSTQYAQAFLCVDFLIERHGVPAIVQYFRSFAVSNDRATIFKTAFGEDFASFSRAATRRLWNYR